MRAGGLTSPSRNRVGEPASIQGCDATSDRMRLNDEVSVSYDTYERENDAIEKKAHGNLNSVR